MRRPSKGYVIMLFAAPLVGSLLLWYVVFPLVEYANVSEMTLNNGSRQQAVFAEDRGGTFFDYHQAANGLSTPGAFSIHQTPTQENTVSGSVQNEPVTGYAGGRSESSNASINTSGAGITKREPYYTIDNTNAELVGSVTGPAQPVIRKAEQIKEKEQVKEKDRGQPITQKGGGGLLLLPPDGDDPQDVPLDGGVSILLAAAIGYGVKKGYDSRKKTLAMQAGSDHSKTG